MEADAHHAPGTTSVEVKAGPHRVQETTSVEVDAPRKRRAIEIDLEDSTSEPPQQPQPPTRIARPRGSQMFGDEFGLEAIARVRKNGPPTCNYKMNDTFLSAVLYKLQSTLPHNLSVMDSFQIQSRERNKIWGRAAQHALESPEFNMVAFPCNYQNSHWTLAIYDKVNNVMSSFDSMEALHYRAQHEELCSYLAADLSIEKPRLVVTKGFHQEDSTSCGFAVIANILIWIHGGGTREHAQYSTFLDYHALRTVLFHYVCGDKSLLDVQHTLGVPNLRTRADEAMSSPARTQQAHEDACTVVTSTSPEIRMNTQEDDGGETGPCDLNEGMSFSDNMDTSDDRHQLNYSPPQLACNDRTHDVDNQPTDSSLQAVDLVLHKPSSGDGDKQVELQDIRESAGPTTGNHGAANGSEVDNNYERSTVLEQSHEHDLEDQPTATQGNQPPTRSLYPSIADPTVGFDFMNSKLECAKVLQLLNGLLMMHIHLHSSVPESVLDEFQFGLRSFAHMLELAVLQECAEYVRETNQKLRATWEADIERGISRRHSGLGNQLTGQVDGIERMVQLKMERRCAQFNSEVKGEATRKENIAKKRAEQQANATSTTDAQADAPSPPPTVPSPHQSNASVSADAHIPPTSTFTDARLTFADAHSPETAGGNPGSPSSSVASSDAMDTDVDHAHIPSEDNPLAAAATALATSSEGQSGQKKKRRYRKRHIQAGLSVLASQTQAVPATAATAQATTAATVSDATTVSTTQAIAATMPTSVPTSLPTVPGANAARNRKKKRAWRHRKRNKWPSVPNATDHGYQGPLDLVSFAECLCANFPSIVKTTVPEVEALLREKCVASVQCGNKDCKRNFSFDDARKSTTTNEKGEAIPGCNHCGFPLFKDPETRENPFETLTYIPMSVYLNLFWKHPDFRKYARNPNLVRRRGKFWQGIRANTIVIQPSGDFYRGNHWGKFNCCGFYASIVNLPPEMRKNPMFTMLVLHTAGVHDPALIFDNTFQPMLDELRSLQRDGITFGEGTEAEVFKVKTHAFLGDDPFHRHWKGHFALTSKNCCYMCKAQWTMYESQHESTADLQEHAVIQEHPGTHHPGAHHDSSTPKVQATTCDSTTLALMFCDLITLTLILKLHLFFIYLTCMMRCATISTRSRCCGLCTCQQTSAGNSRSGYGNTPK